MIESTQLQLGELTCKTMLMVSFSFCYCLVAKKLKQNEVGEGNEV